MTAQTQVSPTGADTLSGRRVVTLSCVLYC